MFSFKYLCIEIAKVIIPRLQEEIWLFLFMNLEEDVISVLERSDHCSLPDEIWEVILDRLGLNGFRE